MGCIVLSQRKSSLYSFESALQKKREVYYFKSLKHNFIVDHDAIIFLFRIVGCVHGLGAICCI